MINVLILEGGTGYGGSSVILHDFLTRIDKTTFTPFLLTFDTNVGPYTKKIAKLGVKNVRLKAPIGSYFRKNATFLFNLLKMFFIITKLNINIIHINNDIYSGMFAIMPAKILRKKIICILRGSFIPDNRQIYFLRFIDKLILLNKFTLDLYSPWAKDKNQLCLVYDGIDCSKYVNEKFDKEHVNREFNLSSQQLVVGTVGRLVDGKGFDDFIKAGSILLKNNNIKFFIVGNSAGSHNRYELRLKNLVSKLNMQKSVIFTGWRDDVQKLINRFNIYVQPSSSYPEGLGTALIEATAMAKPVVATKLAAFLEIVENGKTGFLVPPGNPSKLAQAIFELIEHKEIAEKMAQAGKKRFIENFEVNKMTRNLERIYLEVVDHTTHLRSIKQ